MGQELTFVCAQLTPETTAAAKKPPKLREEQVKDWIIRLDPVSGRPFYYSHYLGKCVWKRPKHVRKPTR